MTDTLRQTATHLVQDLRPLAHNGVAPHAEYPHRAAHHAESVDEDDGQINCICGFNEDDGNTVACDGCNRWQHILCYYPQYGDSLPDDLDHWCVECSPQPDINRHAAHLRQKEAREQRFALHNGVKRPATKSHKKKVKDSSTTGLTYGWPSDRHRHDRNSASPRDQQPPAKRPKTSHRASNSTANAVGAGQPRKRNGSSVHHRRSVSRSPDSPIPLYSEEFLRTYREDSYSVPDTNVAGVAIYEAFATWLYDQEEVSKLTNGTMEMATMSMRWNGAPETLSVLSEIEIRDRHDPNFLTADGQYAIWKYLAASQPLAAQACIGELRGHIQFQDEYRRDPANRWAALRHPEPFVFFHQYLPICIDAREEGSNVRYIRRSCIPNAELKIIITGAADYHFCFMALRDIEAEEEISIAWDASSGLSQAPTGQAGNGISPRDHSAISLWCSTVLANCGPCACGQGRDVCMMARFDKRGEVVIVEDAIKVPKNGLKRKKAGQHISPLNTHYVNSRSGSEVHKVDLEDEPTDSRSVSYSAGRDSASRDITPNTHYSTNGMYEMSERERRKVAKEEELFNKQAEEGMNKHTKKKRSSAGSTLNTPSATSSNQLHLPSIAASRRSEANHSRQAAPSSAKLSNGRRPKLVPLVRSATKSVATPAPAPRPVYINADVQCDMDAEDAERRTPSPRLLRPFVSNRQRLLDRCVKNNATRRRARETRLAELGDADEDDTAVLKIPAMTVEQHDQTALSLVSVAHDGDADMRDALGNGPEPDRQPAEESPAEVKTSPSVASPTAPVPLAPPWPAEAQAKASSTEAKSPVPESSTAPNKPHNMHLDMPPPPSNPFANIGEPPTPLSTTSTPHSITNTLTAASPALLNGPPIFSPSVVAAVNPSPARKKLSLSDYTRRSKAKDREPESKLERESSPVSAISATVPMLLASSSELARVKESGSAVIDEDVKMEDAAAAVG